MEKKENKVNRFGLVGKNISYSFSRGYFTRKFEQLELNSHSYENFDLAEIEAFETLLATNEDIKGLNVTIPYKEAVIPLLTHLEAKAEQIGAVNTIKIEKTERIGYNTDQYGFQKAIEPFLKAQHTQALILGTGGASKAVAFTFETLNIPYKFVSRRPDTEQFSYTDLDRDVLEAYTVLVNCTPLGTFPEVTKKPAIPYTFLGPNHLLFDLIYNPEKTAFLTAGEAMGATICNGYRMLELQAEKAWEIWNQA